MCNVFVAGCKRDSNGYYWITGRTDDCMNVSGHLLSTAQIESALVEHNAVTEAAVVSQVKPCFHMPLTHDLPVIIAAGTAWDTVTASSLPLSHR